MVQGQKKREGAIKRQIDIDTHTQRIEERRRRHIHTQTDIHTDRDHEDPESFCGKEAGDDETESCLLLLLLIVFVVLTVGRVDPGW